MTARTVTVIFTDIVGSTAEFSAMEPAEAERLRSEHVDLVARTVGAFGGAIVKTLGDGVMATFMGAGSGLGAAAAIQREVSITALEVRIGVSAGDALPSGGDWHGPPVIEASRLCAQAGSGQVLVADVVVRLAGSQTHALDDLGDVALKGLPVPTRAFRLRWETADGAPLRVALADDSALVREGIGRLLEAAGVDVVSRAHDGETLLEDVRRLRPDVVVTDLRMPSGNVLGGLIAAEAIRRENARTGIILLSTEVSQHIASRLLANGTYGLGYLSKDRVGDVEQFIEAIRSVAGGGCVLDEALTSGARG